MTWCHLSHFAPISAILHWSLTVEIKPDHFPKRKPWITLKQTCVCWFGSWFPTRVTVWAEDAAKSVCFLPLASGLLTHWGPVYAIYSVEGNTTDVMTCFTLSDFVCVCVYVCLQGFLRPELLGNEFTHIEFPRRIQHSELGKKMLYRDHTMTGW